ncbi:hypothetical protein HMPREF3291_11575 [Bacillus sp. HMSC76G11]|nr:hypothetical protein HMPREF3291_11575 [Bacillus sp. HMSC76G11]
MIKKERKIPIIILQYEALLRRIPENHPKRPYILEELAKSKAGYNGEKSVDYHLALIDQKKYYIYHGLRLEIGPHIFQIDSLLVSKSLLILIETKNILGTLYFDDHFSQLIRTLNGVETGFSDPRLQVDRQETLLQQFLKQNHITCPPFKSLVVISNPSSIIKAPSSLKKTSIIHGANLPSLIKKLESSHPNEILSDNEWNKLSRVLLKKHTLSIRNILPKFNLNAKDLIQGVYCPNCQLLPMDRTFSSWSCQHCRFSSRSVYLHSLIDYALLVSREITNKQAREFLLLPSKSSAYNLLRTFEHSGETKGRKYQLSSLLEPYR